VQNFFEILKWSIFIYIIYCSFLFFVQRQMLFPKNMITMPIAFENDEINMEKHWIDTQFGKCETWFLPPLAGTAQVPAPVIIYAHGNGELIDFLPQTLKKLTEFGFGVLLVEYPGYGRSEGETSQKSITAAFIEAYDYLITKKDVDRSRIILFGTSLGGGAVCALAEKRPTAALILMSTFTSVKSFSLKYFVPGFIVRDPFNNLSVVRRYKGPVLIIHGKYDDLIPYSNGVKLYKSAINGKMITYKAGHNDCPPNWDELFEEIQLFVNHL